MNRELPKPLQDALARQTAGEVHPSPDLLTAFAEHSLPNRESQRVTDHLAKCADCREVVFLASSAVEEPVGEEPEWMPADAISRISPVLRAKLKTGVAGAGLTHEQSRRSWMLRWAWAPVVAAVLIVSGILYQQSSKFTPAAPAMIASKGVPPANEPSQTLPAVVPVPESKTALQLPRPVAKSAPAQANQARAADTLAAAKIESSASADYSSTSRAGATPATPSLAAGAVLGGVLKYPSTGFSTQNSFAESEASTGSNLVAKSQPVVANPQMARQVVSAAHRQWRISPEGHLEQWSASGNWTRALAEQPITFHVVSLVGENVWAGGSGGALFHSSDGGHNWSKQPLAGETGAIVAIRFSDAMHGMVTTETGTLWSTLDGGVTWTKE